MQAAEYVGVGVTKFDELVRDGRMPKPTRIDNRVVWDRLRLDEAFTALFEQGDSEDETGDANQNDWDQLDANAVP